MIVEVIWDFNLNGTNAPTLTLSKISCAVDEIEIQIVASTYRWVENILIILMKENIKQRLTDGVKIFLEANMHKIQECLNDSLKEIWTNTGHQILINNY